MTRSES